MGGIAGRKIVHDNYRVWFLSTITIANYIHIGYNTIDITISPMFGTRGLAFIHPRVSFYAFALRQIQPYCNANFNKIRHYLQIINNISIAKYFHMRYYKFAKQNTRRWLGI